MADLTPELLARLSEEVETWPLGPHPRDEVAARASSVMLHAVPALVAAAKERDQLRAAADLDEAARLRIEAAHLREHSTLEAWSGSLSGLDAAGAASARAAALDELAGIEAPTAEQQRDAALTKLAAVLVERNQLRAEVECLRTLGLEALEWVEASCMTTRATVERIRAGLEHR